MGKTIAFFKSNPLDLALHTQFIKSSLCPLFTVITTGKENNGKGVMRKREKVMFEGEELRLGKWLDNEKVEKGNCTAEQITRIESIGFKYIE